MLETYCEIFNVDWKERMKGGLARNPIYLDGPSIKEKSDIKKIVKEVQKASIPYMTDLIRNMKSFI